MNPRHLDLSWLLGPLEPEDFFSSYWEQRYLHLQSRGSEHYREMLSAETLESFINSADLRYPALQLARDGHYYAPEAYTRDIRYGSESFAQVPDLERVATEYRNGATLTLPALHRTLAPVQQLCAALESELDHAVHANAYLTPGNARGFAPHYDTHEVFVLQIAGHKRWSLYEPPLPLPHRSQPFDPKSHCAGALVAELDLQAGDLLYLPRGYVHSTATSDQYSAHVSVGIDVYTWADLMGSRQPHAAEHPQLRRALPAGFAHRAGFKSRLLEDLQKAIAVLGATENAESLLEGFLRQVRSTRNQRPEAFRIDNRVIDRETVLRPPARGNYLLLCETGRTVLEFAGRRHILPAKSGPLLGAMVSRESFRTLDLPGLDDESTRLGLSRYLFEIGFLSVLQ